MNSHWPDAWSEGFSATYLADVSGAQRFERLSIDRAASFCVPLPFLVRARRTSSMRDGAKRLASGVIARLDESTGDVIEKFEDIRFDVIRRSLSASKKVERSIRKALARFRGGKR